MKVLITAGGTKEFIDGVRYIGNSSTGRTGAQMVDYLVTNGHEVTWLGAKAAIKPSEKCQQVHYETFDELQKQLESVLSSDGFDVVFHAAAVSDFKVTTIILNDVSMPAGRDCKIPTTDQLRINLEKTPKLIDSIKHWSKNPEVVLVGFKLTNSSSKKAISKAINKQIAKGHVDFVAHNNLPDITETKHSLNLHHQSGVMYPCETVELMCEQVMKKMEKVA